MATDQKAEEVKAEKTEDLPEDPTLDAKILRQVEFYFGNSNLPKDKFLKSLTDANNGWAPIATICSFSRMKGLTTNPKAVLRAIRKSTFLEIDDEGSKLRRRTALPTNLDTDARTIYAKGFSEDATLDDLNDFFTTHVGVGERLECVRMRRKPGKGKTFKGSVFVEFSSESEAERWCKLTDLKAPDEDQPLKIMMKKDYVAMKAAEYAAKPKEEKEEKKGKDSKKTDKSKGAKRQRKEGGKDEEKKEGDGDAEEEGEEGAEGEAEEGPAVDKDLIIHFSDLHADTQREDLKKLVEDAGFEVAYVDFSRGKPTAFLRLAKNAGVSAAACAAKLKEAKLHDKPVVVRALEGEEETQYWSTIQTSKSERGRGRGRGRGGRGRGRGRGGRGRGGANNEGKRRKKG